MVAQEAGGGPMIVSRDEHHQVESVKLQPTRESPAPEGWAGTLHAFSPEAHADRLHWNESHNNSTHDSDEFDFSDPYEGAEDGTEQLHRAFLDAYAASRSRSRAREDATGMASRFNGGVHSDGDADEDLSLDEELMRELGLDDHTEAAAGDPRGSNEGEYGFLEEDELPRASDSKRDYEANSTQTASSADAEEEALQSNARMQTGSREEDSEHLLNDTEDEEELDRHEDELLEYDLEKENYGIVGDKDEELDAQGMIYPATEAYMYIVAEDFQVMGIVCSNLLWDPVNGVCNTKAL